jgi:hypothetical protein
MGREINHPVVGKRRPLHHGFAGVAAKMNVAWRLTKLLGDRLEFVSGIDNRRR